MCNLLLSNMKRLVKNRAFHIAAAVVCILCALLLVMQGIVVKSMLEEPEFYAPEIIISDDGGVSYSGEMERNPNYIPEGSRKRAFYNFLMDFTPGGQALRLQSFCIFSPSETTYGALPGISRKSCP